MATILIVDDEPGQRELLESLLRKHGFDTHGAPSGTEALEHLRENVPDLIVSDVRMPGMSGLDLPREVQSVAPAIPFIAVTAYADLRDAVAAIRQGRRITSKNRWISRTFWPRSARLWGCRRRGMRGLIYKLRRYEDLGIEVNPPESEAPGTPHT